MTGRYRLGHKIKHNLYRGDECIAHFHNDADALDAVRALNESAPPPGSPGDTERTPLDRACEAAHKATVPEGRNVRSWRQSPQKLQDLYRTEIAAALRVMADDLRELHTEETGHDANGEEVSYCGGCGSQEWPCQERAIIDSYVGEQS